VKGEGRRSEFTQWKYFNEIYSEPPQLNFAIVNEILFSKCTEIH
jgi:hypothetical protein